MMNVNGMSPYARAILDFMEYDIPKGAYECLCGWTVVPAHYSLLGLADEVIKHFETSEEH